MERKVFTELDGPQCGELNDALSRIGFRRSQNVAYRPSCADCHECISVRVAAKEFRPSSSQKRSIKANTGLIVSECQPWATAEQFALLQRYLEHRHPGGGMAAMDEVDFADMVEHTSVSSKIVEYREADPDGRGGRLVGACLTDIQGDGLSMIYSFYDPEYANRSGLGNYIILDHITRAAEADLPYVYLGYWVEGADRMQYKVRYRPLELLGPEGWRRMGNEEQTNLIAKIIARQKEVAQSGREPEPAGSSKDGAAAMHKQIG